jgi:hypothetical protein
MHRVQPARQSWLQRNGVEALLVATIIFVVCAAASVQYEHHAGHGRVTAEVQKAVARQLLLSQSAANTTSDVSYLLQAMAELQTAQHALDKRRTEAALGGAESEQKRLLRIETATKQSMQRVHADIELARKELLALVDG